MTYYFSQVFQNGQSLDSYIFQNGQWTQLTGSNTVILRDGVKYDVNNFGDISTGTGWSYSEGNGIRFRDSDGLTATSYSYASRFANPVNTSLFNGVKIKGYVTSTSSINPTFYLCFNDTTNIPSGTGSRYSEYYRSYYVNNDKTPFEVDVDISDLSGSLYMVLYLEATNLNSSTYYYITDLYFY